MSRSKLILLVSLFILGTANWTFFDNTLQVYPLADNWLFLLSLSLVILATTVLLPGLFGIGKLFKPVLILMLLIAASSAYFMDSYNIIIDHTMLDNALATDPREVRDLLSWRLFFYLLLIGLLPSVWISRLKLDKSPLKPAFTSRLLLLAGSLLLVFTNIYPFSKQYTPFFREHKVLRSYITPTYPLHSAYKFLAGRFHQQIPHQAVALDARPGKGTSRPRLLLLVVGETARRDHFSLNGYDRKTNPALERQDVLSYRNVTSCGTSTAVSVPCMFSPLDRRHYDKTAASHMDNVLDILQRSGVRVLWLDNNSSSKQVAARVGELDYRQAGINPICDSECRDPGMLAHLDEYLGAETPRDTPLCQDSCRLT